MKKMEAISFEQIAKLLRENDNFLVLMHKSPDGYAAGCAYAMCALLRNMGKKAQPLCGDEIPSLFSVVSERLPVQQFEPEFIISVDLATEALLSGKALDYAGKIDLCIDHHGINSGYAKYGYVDAKSASCAEVLKHLFDSMGEEITPLIADALFMGVSTDTGCFKYSNVTPSTHRVAAELMECGADSFGICRRFFDTKTRSKLALEKMMLETIDFAADGEVAFVCVTKKMLQDSGATQGDLDGIAGITKQIEGVKIGITMKEKEDGEFRISVRSSDGVSAADICSSFGGGGHFAAAGCSINGTLEEAKKAIIDASVRTLRGESA